MNYKASVVSALLALFLGILMLTDHAYGQETNNSLEFSPQVSLGIFTADHKLGGNAFGGELIYHMNESVNPRPWMKKLNLRSIDLVFNYKNMSDVVMVTDPRPNRFGDSYALLAALNFSLLKLKNTELSITPGLGLGYLGETYFTNGNILIGSHLNFTSRIALKVETRLSSTTKLSAGLDILHFSNAGTRVPNNGMNISSVSLGFIHALEMKKASSAEVAAWKQPMEYKKHSFDLGANIGRRGVYRSKEGLYKTGLYAGYNYRLNTVLGLSAGFDAVYYHTVFDGTDNTFQSKATSLDRWRTGVGIGPDLWMGRLALMAKYGYYLHYNNFSYSGSDIKTYWTAGLKYSVLNWAAVQSKIYIHQTEADFVGFGLLFTL